MEEILGALQPLTPAVVGLAESGIFPHADPADRLIAVTALYHQIPLITADEKLRTTPGVVSIW